MTDKKFEARYSALTLWAVDAEARGFLVPCAEDLASIAKAKSVDAPGVDVGLVGAWSTAIKEVIKHVAFNIADPHRQLGPELYEPETDAGRQSATESRSEPSPAVGPGARTAPAVQRQTPEGRVLEALKTWRDGETAQGRPFISNLKESHLHQVANSGMTAAEDIRRMFPPAAGRFADEVARVVADSDPGASPGVPAVEVAVSAEPRATPAAEPPARKPATVEAGREPAGPIDPKSFAQFEYGPSKLNPAAITIRRDGEGSRQYSWPHSGSDQPIKIYRVISSDDHPPYSPDQADLICVADHDSAVDGRPLGAAVRHLQVWLNEGPSIGAAVAAQPILHAQGAFVGEVLDLKVTEDEGRIIGQWSALPGTRSVQVFRIPIEKAASAGGDPQYRILAESDNLGGFVDARAERGSHYLYQVYAEAVVDGVARLSSPTSSSLKVSVVLEPVSDLEIRLSSDPDVPYFDLEWGTPAGGTVSIYRTERPPISGIELEALSADSLAINGLKDESRLSHPIALSQGRASMVSVPWPTGWTRAYFTPVTLLDGMALVGGTTFKSRREKVRNPKILERVNSQILTFDWPAGAASVMVYRGQTGTDPELALSGDPLEITQADYQQRGGLHFSDQLPSIGCDLHLVPVSFEAGRRVSGAPSTVAYPPILRLGYQIGAKKSLLGRMSALTVSVHAINPTPSMPPFVLVYNPERLPLTVLDGVALSMVSDGDDASPPARRFVPDINPGPDGIRAWKTEPEAWSREVIATEGYVRLFADLPVDVLRTVALLDPPLRSLRLAGPLNPFKGMFDGR